MKKSFVILAALIVLMKISSGFAQENNYKEITLKPYDKVRQGGTIFINIKSPEKLKKPTFTYKNKTYELFKNGENLYSGMLGISALEKPGTYKISMTDKSGSLNDNAFIQVTEHDFPDQNIVLTNKMSGLSASAEELKKIGEAKRKLTKEFRGLTPPYDSPAEGCINSIFGVRRLYNGKFSGNYHKGVDIKADEGIPVKAITSGKVIFSEDFRLHGTSIAVDHGQGLVSLYIHLSKVEVEAGDIVEAGQKIGEVGETGFATGPHLHWGLYVNGTPVDPMTDWIKPVKICM